MYFKRFDMYASFFLYGRDKQASAPFTYQCWGLPHGLAQCTALGVGQVCSVGLLGLHDGVHEM